MNKHIIASTFILSTFSAVALAQAPAAASAEPLARHSCTRPALPDAAKKLTTVEKNAVVANMETFRNCIRAFSDGQEKIKVAKEQEAKSLQESSQVALGAARSAKSSVDGATADYNAFSTEAKKILKVEESAEAAPGTAAPAPARPVKYY